MATTRKTKRQNQMAFQEDDFDKLDTGPKRGAEIRSKRQKQQRQSTDRPRSSFSPESGDDYVDNSTTTKHFPFERIGGDETSMDGPVTYARAMRGEIPMRESMQNLQNADEKRKKPAIYDEPGVKLTIELNLDLEVELKASIHGDLTLSLM